jgi:hypothetical protein
MEALQQWGLASATYKGDVEPCLIQVIVPSQKTETGIEVKVRR